jgi:uncharacterized membrane protein
MKSKATRRRVEGVKPADAPAGKTKSPLLGGIQVKKSVTIDRPRQELFTYWRNFQNFGHFMVHVESVQVIDDRRSHWIVKAPMGRTVEWDAEIITETPNELISWRSTENAEIENAGSVTFRDAPEGRGTMVTVTLSYNPPGGKAGDLIAMLFGEEPAQQLSEDVRRFKALMETGEIPTNQLRRETQATAGRSSR